MTEKERVIKKISEDFDYTIKELEKWKFIEIEADNGMFGNVFFSGDYVFFAEDKVIWY